MRVLRAAALALVALPPIVLAACGQERQAKSGFELASWRERVCAAAIAYERALDSTPSADGDISELAPAANARRGVEAMRDYVSAVRAIPLPTDRRADAGRYVDMLARLAERYE